MTDSTTKNPANRWPAVGTHQLAAPGGGGGGAPSADPLLLRVVEGADLTLVVTYERRIR